MELRPALKEQYHGGLTMLLDCLEKCPAEAWTTGEFPRSFWRIALHAIYFTHLYMGQGEDAFVPWPERGDEHPEMWQRPWEIEPYELPANARVLSKDELTAYLKYVDGLVDNTVNGLDLDTDESGFGWYRNISKVSHQLMNLRHLQGHVGQLSELLMARGIDTRWIAKGGSAHFSL